MTAAEVANRHAVTSSIVAEPEAPCALTIRGILDLPALVPLWPTVGKALGGLAESTVYQLAAEDRLPFEVIRLGRRRYVRTVDIHAFLGLLTRNDNAAEGATSTASVERISETTSK